MRALVFGAIFLIATPAIAHEPVPVKEGQCVITKIKDIGTRLGIPDSGDALTYTNGIDGVSYDTIKGLKGARVGDSVKLCLIALPQDCPPGDNRGKSYKATDLRTHKSWDALDSEHMCGGA